MSDTIFLWVGRVWSATALAIVLRIATAVIGGRIADRRQRRRDVRLVRGRVRELFPNGARAARR